MTETRRPRVAVDFDGVLVEDSPNVHADWEAKRARPVIPGAAAGTRWLRRHGWRVWVWTSRPDTHREWVEAQLTAAGVSYDHLLFDSKPTADLYIDDKALRFSGWPAVVEWVGRHPGARSVPVGHAEPDGLVEEEMRRLRFQGLMPMTGMRVLDVGCGGGTGWAGRTLAGEDGPWPCWLSVVEPDKSCHESILRHAKPCRLYYSLVEAIEDGLKYDLILGMGVLEHVDDPAAVLKAMLSLAALESRVYLTVPNAHSFHRRVGVEMGVLRHLEDLTEADHVIGHQRYYSPERWGELIGGFASGASYVSVGSVGFKPLPSRALEEHLGVLGAFSRVARELEWSGPFNFLGAELYADIRFRKGDQ